MIRSTTRVVDGDAHVGPGVGVALGWTVGIPMGITTSPLASSGAVVDVCAGDVAVEAGGDHVEAQVAVRRRIRSRPVPVAAGSPGPGTSASPGRSATNTSGSPPSSSSPRSAGGSSASASGTEVGRGRGRGLVDVAGRSGGGRRRRRCRSSSSSPQAATRTAGGGDEGDEGTSEMTCRRRQVARTRGSVLVVAGCPPGDLVDDAGVGQRRGVAEVTALGHVAQQAAHDLAGSGLRAARGRG